MTMLHQVWYGTVTRNGAFGGEPGDRSLHPLLRGLDPQFVAALAPAGRSRTYLENERLVEAGQAADRFFLLHDGFISLELEGPRPGGTRIGTLGAGDAFGRSRLRPVVGWPFRARALESTVATVIDARGLRTALEEWPVAGTHFLRRLLPWSGTDSGEGPILVTRIPMSLPIDGRDPA
jgi:CRP-like cAMP-binding protein